MATTTAEILFYKGQLVQIGQGFYEYPVITTSKASYKTIEGTIRWARNIVAYRLQRVGIACPEVVNASTFEELSSALLKISTPQIKFRFWFSKCQKEFSSETIFIGSFFKNRVIEIYFTPIISDKDTIEGIRNILIPYQIDKAKSFLEENNIKFEINDDYKVPETASTLKRLQAWMDGLSNDGLWFAVAYQS